MKDFVRAIPLTLWLSFGGLLISGFALWMAFDDSSPASRETAAIARVESSFGRTTLSRSGLSKEVVQKTRAFQRLDTLETAAGAEALIEFSGGDRVRVLENSIVFADLEQGRPLLIVKAGEIWVERIVDSNQGPLISRAGVRRSLAQDDQERRRLEIRQNAMIRPQVEKMKKPNARVGALLESLTPDAIEDTVRSHRHLFFKCYGQLLQRKPGMKGDASITFTIERSGKVTNPQINSARLEDPAFKRCLADSMKRIEFRSFAGEAVQTLFPLRFE